VSQQLIYALVPSPSDFVAIGTEAVHAVDWIPAVPPS
jgi:hypothetical protein